MTLAQRRPSTGTQLKAMQARNSKLADTNAGLKLQLAAALQRIAELEMRLLEGRGSSSSRGAHATTLTKAPLRESFFMPEAVCSRPRPTRLSDLVEGMPPVWEAEEHSTPDAAVAATSPGFTVTAEMNVDSSDAVASKKQLGRTAKSAGPERKEQAMDVTPKKGVKASESAPAVPRVPAHASTPSRKESKWQVFFTPGPKPSDFSHQSAAKRNWVEATSPLSSRAKRRSITTTTSSTSNSTIS